ncbi:MAG: ATPase domain-containing protein [Myxococcota bacterium]|nr:ATPase domain-containing protein [Myxococcota bacterium]
MVLTPHTEARATRARAILREIQDREPELAGRIQPGGSAREASQPGRLPTGIEAVDALLAGGLPRGRVSEITGAASSGRTSLALALLAQATRTGEVVAVVDAADAFDPASALTAGLDLSRTLWVRPPDPRIALRCTERLLEARGFALVVLDLNQRHVQRSHSNSARSSPASAEGARSEPQASEVHQAASARQRSPWRHPASAEGARSEAKPSEVHQDAPAPAKTPYAGTPASAEGARSEPQASEVHQACARSEPQASEVHQACARSEPQASEVHKTSIWLRFQRSAAASGTALLVLGTERVAGGFSALSLEARVDRVRFARAPDWLEGLDARLLLTRNRLGPAEGFAPLPLKVSPLACGVSARPGSAGGGGGAGAP